MNETLCLLRNKNLTLSQETKYCPPVFDGTLCWNYTEAGTNSSQRCPQTKGFDPALFTWRHCNEDGTWFDNNSTKLKGVGFTHYKNCLKPSVLELMEWCDKMGIETCTYIAKITRIIERVGLLLSLQALIVSLIIFNTYRVLENNRTRIHKNLFIAMIMQVIVRIIIYESEVVETINYLCEGLFVFLEFTKLATIMWMFIEGLYLHNAITVTVFQEHSYIKIYCYVGWIAPFILVFIWVSTMVHKKDKCWYLYHFLPNYWILEGTTSALIVVNILFLLNILRILVLKLRESKMGEIQKLKKAVKGALVLVPLMGTPNVLHMIDFRTFTDAWKFGLWSYTTYFLTTFQGFFIAFLYCFLNGEVKNAVKNSLTIYRSLRQDNLQRRNSTEETRLSAAETEIVPRKPNRRWFKSFCAVHKTVPQQQKFPETSV